VNKNHETYYEKYYENYFSDWDKSIYDLAIFMHKVYLELSKIYNLKVQEGTDIRFEDLPFINQRVLVVLAGKITASFLLGDF